MGIYFYYGEEDFNIDLKLKDLKSKLNPDFKSMNLQNYSSPAYPELIQILRTPPMMFGSMLIIIDAYNYFFRVNNKEVKFEDNELCDIENALKNNSDNIDIVFIVRLPRDEQKKIDSRRKLFKILKQFTSEEFEPMKTSKTDLISNWINKRAKAKKITLNEDAVQLLISNLGNNLMLLDTELDKLQLIAHPATNITKKMVENVAISKENLFNITELIISNKKDKALLEFQKLVSQKHPLEIIAALQTIIRKWIIIKLKSSEMSSFDLSKLVGLPEFVITKQIKPKLKNTQVADLIKLKQNLYEVEYKLKTAESLDIISEVECAIIR